MRKCTHLNFFTTPLNLLHTSFQAMRPNNEYFSSILRKYPGSESLTAEVVSAEKLFQAGSCFSEPKLAKLVRKVFSSCDLVVSSWTLTSPIHESRLGIVSGGSCLEVVSGGCFRGEVVSASGEVVSAERLFQAGSCFRYFWDRMSFGVKSVTSR